MNIYQLTIVIYTIFKFFGSVDCRKKSTAAPLRGNGAFLHRRRHDNLLERLRLCLIKDPLLLKEVIDARTYFLVLPFTFRGMVLPFSPCRPPLLKRRKPDEQTRSGRFCQTLQRPHRGAHTAAFQARDNRLSRPHLPGQLLLRKTRTVARVDHGRRQDKLLLKRVVSLPVPRLLHPFLV